MFLAHLPAGYLLTRAIERRRGHRPPGLMATGLVASVLPDSDLFYFYFLSNRQVPHHAYITHWPLAWLGLALVALLLLKLTRQWKYAIFIVVILANALLHMVLDSVAAEIYWLQPFSDVAVNLIAVPAGYRWWVWNFLLHWSFLLELAITFVAALVWWRDRRRALCFARAAAFTKNEG